MKITKTLFLLMFLAVYSLGYSQPYAIPGAKGFGKNTRGAYSGPIAPTVLYVDRLTDDFGNDGVDRGSFRWCVTREFPRIVLFEVSGYISINSDLKVFNPYLTIYGQTSPTGGITLTGDFYLDIQSDHTIVQHLRFRPSYKGIAQRDAMSITNAKNIFIDHCSFSYAEDECIGISGGVTGDYSTSVTIQNCLFEQPLDYTVKPDGTYENSGKGVLAQDGTDSLSIISSAFIHCADRSPYPNGADWTKVEVVNTAAYNMDYWGISLDEGDADNNPEASIIGNLYKYGPSSNSQSDRQVVRLRRGINEGDSVYLYGNYSEARKSDTSEWNGVVYYEDGVRDSSDFKRATPYPWAETADWLYTELEDSLVANAGARPWDRDSVDINNLSDFINRTGTRIDSIEQAYFPTIDGSFSAITVPYDPHNDAGNGYTNLEVWVYEMTKDSSSGTPPSDTCNYLSISGIVVNETDNEANGAITTSTTGGTPAYSYLWEDGSTTENRINLSEGTYGVTVTDAKGCADTAGFNVINIDSGSGFMDTVLIDSILINPTVQAMTDNGWINMLTSSITSDTISIYEINFRNSNGIGYTPITGWPDNVAGSFHYGNSYNGIRMIVKNISSDYIYRVEGISNRDDASVRNQYVSVHGDTITVDVMDENNCTYSFDNVKAIGDSITIAVDPISSYYTYINGIKIYIYEIQPVQRTYNSLIGTSVNSNRQIEGVNEQIPFQLYPNPAENNLTISELQVGARVYIYNSKGQSVLRTVATSDNLEISLTGFTPGFYITKVEIGGETYTSKFIKK